jgi:hypothetical protein
MEHKQLTLTLAEDLYQRIQENAQAQSKTAEDIIVGLLQEKFPVTDAGMSKEEEDKVKERLKALGYMD